MLVNAVVYFKVVNPEAVIIKIEDHIFAVKQYTQAALRDVIGNSEMDFVLTEREQIAESIKKIVDAETIGWGVDVEAIKIQEVELPAEMKRAMAKQAEAERERRAMIIASQGELSASENLREAAENLSRSSGAIQKSPRIIIEAGTPFIKREGEEGIRAIHRYWPGHIVADLKVRDGAYTEVRLAQEAGATAAMTLGSAPVETLDIFITTCEQLGVDSMVDMLGVNDPLRVILRLKKPPKVIILHRGRDEESTRGKVIQYRHVNRLRSKYDALISAAGGVDLKEARNAIFNGANIVVVNLVMPGDPWQGISTKSDVASIARQFLDTIE